MDGETKLGRLHEILQAVFEWEDYHLHEFQAGGRVYGAPEAEDAAEGRMVQDERRVALRRVAVGPGARFVYVYDFGDSREHEIVVEGVVAGDARAAYPRCVAGARNGPPEDAGGPVEYADYVAAVGDPKHPAHREMLEWRGPFEAEAFSVAKINGRLRRRFGGRTKQGAQPTRG